MSKICKKRVHRNEEKKLPGDFKKVSWVGLFTNTVELFNKCLKEDCFPDCWKVLSVVVIFKNVGERSTAKNYHPVSLFSVVTKVFENFLNSRIVDYLKKYGLFF